MERIHSHQSLTYLGYLKGLLEQDGIKAVIKNEGLHGALGEIPFVECWPELWVLDTQDTQRAKAIIEEAERAPVSGANWRCSTCGEENEPQFALCWSCGGPVSA